LSISSAIASDRLARLRNQKKIAIQGLDFDAAEDFDRQLNTQNEQIAADRISNDILKEVQDRIATYNGIRSNITDGQANEESRLNTTYRDLFDKARTRHEKELRDVDKSHGIAVLGESGRETPAQLSLLEQAKAAAMSGQFDDARQLREEACEDDVEARRRRTDQKFCQSPSMRADTQEETIAQFTWGCL
jgi:hypothetical protein